MDGLIKDSMLLQMLEWYAGAESNWVVDTSFKGRHIEEWLGKELWNEVKETFACEELDVNWSELFKTFDLYRKIATTVSQKLGYRYPIDVDKKMVSLIRGIYEN